MLGTFVLNVNKRNDIGLYKNEHNRYKHKLVTNQKFISNECISKDFIYIQKLLFLH